MPTNRETLLCRYHYDPLDRLAACSLSEQASTQRFYLKSRLATEIKGSVQRSIFQHDDQLLAQQQRQNGTVETTLLATDQQRSVVNALDATQPRPLAYTLYGHRAPEGGLLSLLGFNGERPDPVTGHYLLGNGYRAFNPVLMRFNSPDSWSPFGEGGLNPYAYCEGEPVNRSDPTGHSLLLKALMMFQESIVTPRGAFQKLSGTPHLSQKIAGYLSGKDLASFSQASTFTHSVVQTIENNKLGLLASLAGDPIKKIAGYLKGNDLASFAATSKTTKKIADLIQVPPRYVAENGRLTKKNLLQLREIALGEAPGFLPRQVLSNNELLSTSKFDSYPDNNNFARNFNTRLNDKIQLNHIRRNMRRGEMDDKK